MLGKSGKSASLSIEKQECEGGCRITVSGEVDLSSSPALREAILKASPKGGGLVAIDLSGVSYMDSSGVATLVEGLKSTGQGSFCLLAPSAAVMKVLQLSRLDSVFDIRDTL